MGEALVSRRGGESSGNCCYRKKAYHIEAGSHGSTNYGNNSTQWFRYSDSIVPGADGKCSLPAGYSTICFNGITTAELNVFVGKYFTGNFSTDTVRKCVSASATSSVVTLESDQMKTCLDSEVFVVTHSKEKVGETYDDKFIYVEVV